jgi:tetratricopeptide (TPR) repeat protein
MASHGQDDRAHRPSGPAPAGGIAAGTVVVLKAPDLLLRGDGRDRSIPSGDGTWLKVVRIDDDRLLVASPDEMWRGWVGGDRVIPLDQAMDYFDRAIARNPGDVDSLRMRGRLWASRGEFDRALADFDRALRLAPDRARAYVDRGGLLGQRGQLDRAIADYTEAIKLDPREAEAYLARASAWVNKHDRQQAVSDYTAAIELEPKNPWYFLLRGQVWTRQGEHARAVADFDEAIRLDPTNSDSYVARAIEWEKDLKPDRALSDYQVAISLAPNSVVAYQGRGRIWKKTGEYEKVVTNFAELARMVPDDPLGHREFAWILATCDQDAIRDGRRAVGAATTACALTKWADPDCLEALAAACAEVGDFDAAVKWQTRALEIFTANSDKADRRIIIKKRQDADMSHRLYRYKKRLPYYERPDRAAR